MFFVFFRILKVSKDQFSYIDHSMHYMTSKTRLENSSTHQVFVYIPYANVFSNWSKRWKGGETEEEMKEMWSQGVLVIFPFIFKWFFPLFHLKYKIGSGAGVYQRCRIVFLLIFPFVHSLLSLWHFRSQDQKEQESDILGIRKNKNAL